jgi:hypothetical protein
MRIFLPPSPDMFCDFCSSNSLQSVPKTGKDTHARVNFVRMRYGGVEVDFVRESTIVCLSAQAMQNAFLIRPDNVEM